MIYIREKAFIHNLSLFLLYDYFSELSTEIALVLPDVLVNITWLVLDILFTGEEEIHFAVTF